MMEAAAWYMGSEVDRGDVSFVYGFHSPGQNSQFHLHMHCIALPLINPKYEKRYVGAGLVKADYVFDQLQTKQSKL